MTLSKEWLDGKLNDCELYHHAHQAPINVKELRDVIRELLALRERAEPDYIRYDCGCCGWETIEDWRDNDACPKCNHKPMGKTELYATPPAPVVPDCLQLLLKHAEGLTFGSDWNNGTAAKYHRDALIQAVKDCRAAMLQGAEPVSQPYNLPDGWIKCSERMPETDDFVYIWPRPDFGVELHVGQYGKFDKRDAGWYAQLNEQNYGIAYHPITVTHWQPLPAAPGKEG